MTETLLPSGSNDPGTGASDPRGAAFCSPEHPELFHAVAYRNDVWKEDPFDVETIHEEARATFQQLVHRATAHAGAAGSGRILLLQGEAGSGKTHLMRAFRNWTHAAGRGYYGYMQMTSATSHYGRYILYNLIDSLDQAYDESAGGTTGLMRLSTAVAESPRLVAIDRLEQIRNGELDTTCLARMVDALADQIVLDDRFNAIDIDLLRALLYLQGNDPRIKSRVLKYLRCEGLSAADRQMLGGIVPRSYDDAPQWVIQRLAELMAALESVPLILCVDQLEDIYNLDEAPARFRRALACLCDLVSRIPSAVVVISCLEDFYRTLRDHLTSPIVDRVENDPKPIVLKGTRDAEEIHQLVERRLRFLYESLGVEWLPEDPTYPFLRDDLGRLAGLPTRTVLSRCQEYRDRCLAAGRLVELAEISPPREPRAVDLDATRLEQEWNDHRSSFSGETPGDEEGLAALLAEAIGACSDELETGLAFGAARDGRMIEVTCRFPDHSVVRLLAGLCELSARGGGLGRQIAEVVNRAGREHTPVIVRSTEYPSNPKAAVTRQLGELITGGGRRVVVEDSDWRTMAAFPSFRARHQGLAAFPDWLRKGQPLSRLRSLRTILDLDRVGAMRPAKPEALHGSAPPETPAQPAPPPVAAGTGVPAPEPAAEPEPEPLIIGRSDDRAKAPVVVDPAELTRHAAFLGGTGSGKTTLALNVVEQLLLRGVPAILVDRKGDLCGYARAEAWTRPESCPELAARRERLRDRLDVAVFTPGNPRGRPLSIAIAPPELGQLGSFERGQVARYAASALAGMMNYGGRTGDQARQAILAQAIELLAQIEPAGAIALGDLIEYVAEKDPALINAVGRLDTRLFERLVQDLETLRLTKGELLTAQGEPLDPEMLFGLGRHAVPGRTRLSIVSTKFLAATQDVQFWVSQLLVALGRWASRSPAPAGRLQAVVLFDEADLYLPASRRPPTKEPMEDLLRRARSAGLGLLLATQSPGDFDYKCRDNIRAWFVGRVKEATALAKMKPMLSECRLDVTARLPVQETGHFHLLRDGAATAFRADRSAIGAEQLPEDEILDLARPVPGSNGSPG